ncbi:MAG: hypothetical protein R3E86_14555 [Pseudomonadales bacterium]
MGERKQISSTGSRGLGVAAAVAIAAGGLATPWLVLPALVPGATPPALQWAISIAVVCAAAYTGWSWWSLRTVFLDDQGLVVRANPAIGEVLVPYEEIERVNQPRRGLLRNVTIRLRGPSPLGTRIRFRPCSEPGWAIREHSVVQELRDRAAGARASAPGR